MKQAKINKSVGMFRVEERNGKQYLRVEDGYMLFPILKATKSHWVIAVTNSDVDAMVLLDVPATSIQVQGSNRKFYPVSANEWREW